MKTKVLFLMLLQIICFLVKGQTNKSEIEPLQTIPIVSVSDYLLDDTTLHVEPDTGLITLYGQITIEGKKGNYEGFTVVVAFQIDSTLEYDRSLEFTTGRNGKFQIQLTTEQYRKIYFIASYSDSTLGLIMAKEIYESEYVVFDLHINKTHCGNEFLDR